MPNQLVRISFSAAQRLGRRGPRVQGPRRTPAFPRSRVAKYMMRLYNFAKTHPQYNLRVPTDPNKLLVPA